MDHDSAMELNGEAYCWANSTGTHNYKSFAMDNTTTRHSWEHLPTNGTKLHRRFRECQLWAVIWPDSVTGEWYGLLVPHDPYGYLFQMWQGWSAHQLVATWPFSRAMQHPEALSLSLCPSLSLFLSLYLYLIYSHYIATNNYSCINIYTYMICFITILHGSR